MEDPKFSLRDIGILLYKNKMYVGTNQTLKDENIHYGHTSSIAGHAKYDKTLH
jgi:hypothetical protein